MYVCIYNMYVYVCMYVCMHVCVCDMSWVEDTMGIALGDGTIAVWLSASVCMFACMYVCLFTHVYDATMSGWMGGAAIRALPHHPEQ